MVTVLVRDPQDPLHAPAEGPAEVTEGNVQYWCKHTRSLTKPIISKALKFLRHDCIKYVGDENEYYEKNCFVCLPLNTASEWTDPDTGRVFKKLPYKTDYNSTVYTIRKVGGAFMCNCQGWTFRERQDNGAPDGCSCCHVLTLFMAF